MKEIAKRFKEPSSWAGISMLLTLAAPHIGLTAEAAQAVVHAGVGVAGLLAVVLPESKDD